jgi:hypothetical protein
MALDKASADIALTRASTTKAAGNFTVTAEEAAALKAHGINLPAGATIDDNVLTALTGLRGHEVAASSAASSARHMGTPQKLMDNQGNITGWAFPATGQFVPNTHGGRASGMGAGELDRRGMLKLIGDSVMKLEEVASKNKASIGYYAGKVANAKRSGALDFLGVSSTAGENDLFHIAGNLSDLLLRARSGAQINEQEYQRLKNLTPDPTKSESRFFEDLANFKDEFNQVASVRGMGTADTPYDTSTAPGYGPGSAAPGGDLRSAVRDFLSRRNSQQ